MPIATAQTPMVLVVLLEGATVTMLLIHSQTVILFYGEAEAEVDHNIGTPKTRDTNMANIRRSISTCSRYSAG